MWIHYDPNWRQFIGTNFAVIVDHHGAVLPDALVDDLRASIDRCVTGEPDDRVAPTYANIALMKAWLDTWAGRTEIGEALARATYAHFDPTGVPRIQLADVLRHRPLGPCVVAHRRPGSLRELGADMEARLWRDIARFYHAGLRNLCGPYDRAYGMEMTVHATPLGLHIWSVVGRERAPFPDTSGRFLHPHDLCFGPLVAAVPTRVPDDVVAHLEAFRGEREIEQIVSDVPDRVVTAWLGADEMIGAWTGPPSGIGFFQHAHATIHTSSGWVRLVPQTAADARASVRALEISADASISLEIHGDIGPRFEAPVEPQRDGDVLTFALDEPATVVVSL